MTSKQDRQSPIGVNEVLAIGLGVVALWRIRNRRKREKAQAEADRALHEGELHEPGADESVQA